MNRAPLTTAPAPFTSRPRWVDAIVLLAAAAVLLVLILLGNWQVQRLAWKLDLIDTVATRAYGEPVAPPVAAADPALHDYLRVRLSGEFLHRETRRVKALTELGAGSWLLTPLETPGGSIWINRGFVPMFSEPGDWTEPEGTQVIEGLLRMTQPGGTLLEKNDPQANRWFSVDVAALDRAAGLISTRDYFVDAADIGAAQLDGAAPWPRSGLTKLTFTNNHLIYAITWYGMALLLMIAVAYAIRFQGFARSRPRGHSIS
ncbi:MAG: SURF1 family cytochrome oxidase biogenesis protein [Pseudomonadota bacterium]